MNSSPNLTDPSTICEVDKVKLAALYGRVCPLDVLNDDDPRRDCITAEMLDIGLAPTPELALEVIAWWDPVSANLAPIVESVRRSFRNLKLAGSYSHSS